MIDFDRYRSDAYRLRRQALQDASKLSAAFKFVVIVVLLLGAVAVAPSKQDANACHNCTSVTTDKSSSAQRPSRAPRTVIPQSPAIY
jgi:hypothetical protein